MEDLAKTIKKLSEEEYQNLLQKISGGRKNKPWQVLEALRKQDLEDSEMMEMLDVNRSTYYTLKSRLNTDIAEVFFKEVAISALKDEVARVPANLYGSNKTFAVRALKELEKQLIEYDLSNELIVVYKTLARLHLFDEEYPEYERLYNKHVAFSLAVVKAEDLFFDFIRKMGIYWLTRQDDDLEKIRSILREMSNILELYDSHRMTVMYNIVKIYYLCADPQKREGLRTMEIEIEQILTDMTQTFGKYNQDTFYQSIIPLVDLLFFEFYQSAGNIIRADHYHQKVMTTVPDLCKKHIMNFFVVKFLNTKIVKFLQDEDLTKLQILNTKLVENLEIETNEFSHFIAFRRFNAVCRFYEGDFPGAAKLINDLRNRISFKAYLKTDIELKLFQALQYCILGDDPLCQQIMQSIKRQIKVDEKGFEDADLYVKLMKTALKASDFRKKIKKITEINQKLAQLTITGQNSLWYVKLEDSLIRRMANPIK